MNELVKVKEECISGDLVQAVDARELHEFLEVKTPFHKWISRRIEEMQLIENREFIITDKFVHNSAGRPGDNYAISLDTAKHLAMIERNEKGFQIREYFIEVEKKAKENQIVAMENPIVKLALQYAKVEDEQRRQLQLLIDQQKQIDNIKEDIDCTENYFKARAFANMKGLRLTRMEHQKFGKQAAHVSRQRGYRIDPAICPEWGKVNRYHIDVLEEVYKQWI